MIAFLIICSYFTTNGSYHHNLRSEVDSVVDSIVSVSVIYLLFICFIIVVVVVIGCSSGVSLQFYKSGIRDSSSCFCYPGLTSGTHIHD